MRGILTVTALLVLVTGAVHSSDSAHIPHLPADYNEDIDPDEYISSVLDSVVDRYRLEYKNKLGHMSESGTHELESLRRRHEDHKRFLDELSRISADQVPEDHMHLGAFLDDVAGRHETNAERLDGIESGDGSFTKALVEYLRENQVSLDALETLFVNGRELSTLKGFWEFGHLGYSRVLFESPDEREAQAERRASDAGENGVSESLNALLSTPQVGESCKRTVDCSGVEVCCLTTYEDPKCTVAPQCVMPTDIPGNDDSILGTELLLNMASSYSAGRESYSAKEHAESEGYTCKAFEVEDQGPCPFCAAFALSVAVSERLCIATKGVANTMMSPQWLVENFHDWHHQRKDFRDTDHESSTVAPGFLGANHEMAGLAPYEIMSDDKDSLEENNGGALPLWCLKYHCTAPSLKARKSVAKAASKLLGKIKTRSGALLGDNPLVDTLRQKEMVRNSRPMAGWFGVRVNNRAEAEAMCGDKVVRTLVDSDDPADFVEFDDGVRPGYFLRLLMKDGPFAVGISMDLRNPKSWKKVGNVYVPRRFFNFMDHDVVLVGFGTEMTPRGPLDYYLIQNSYGADWGENGYFKVQRGVPEACRGYYKGLGSFKQNAEYTGPCGLDMFVAHYTATPAPALRGPRISPHTLDQWEQLSKKCKPCKNNGEMLRDCSCHCFQPWSGPQCELCTRSCGFGTLDDSGSCSCTCSEGAWGSDCSKRIVLRVCSRDAASDAGKKEVMVGVEQAAGLMPDEDGWIELYMTIKEGADILDRDLFVNVESGRLQTTEYLFEDGDEFDFNALYNEREDTDEFGRTRGVIRRKPHIVGGVSTPCGE